VTPELDDVGKKHHPLRKSFSDQMIYNCLSEKERVKVSG